MSTISNRNVTSNQSTFDRNVAKVFLGGNNYEQVTLKDQAATVSLALGTLMGRAHATGEVTPLKSAATDGTQIPYGILASEHDVESGDQPIVSVCISGEVNKGLVIFDGTDDFDTVVTNRRLDDRINGDTKGIKLVASAQLSKFDN